MPDLNDIPLELKDRIEAFYARVEKIPEELATELDKAEPPAVIYHYTDGAGLRGIIESGNIRLGDIFYPSELRHGVNFALEALNSAAENGPDEVRLFARQFRRVHTAGIEASAHFFVTSFSGADDDLGQWRAYADDGRGYAIGFDGKALEEAFAKKDGLAIPGHTTFPITYDDKRLRDMQNRIVSEALPLISAPRGLGLSGETIASFMSELSVNLAVPVMRSALFLSIRLIRTRPNTASCKSNAAIARLQTFFIAINRIRWRDMLNSIGRPLRRQL